MPDPLPSSTTAPGWPDGVDWPITIAYLTLVIALPALGYFFMVLDYRAYLRSLRRALMVVTGGYRYSAELPEWVRKNTPRCILVFGLTLPCTQEEVLAAYRRKVKELHPDRGGDRRKFLRLQAHFEQAMALVNDECRIPE